MGEVSDKATQSEIQELEGTIQQSQSGQGNVSMLQELLKQVPRYVLIPYLHGEELALIPYL